MKKVLLLILAAMTAISCSDEWEAPEWTMTESSVTLARSDHPLSREEAWQLIRHKFFGGKDQNIKVVVHESMSLVEPNTQYAVGRNMISPDYRCWLFFLEDNPWLRNQRGRYVFVSEYGDNIQIKNSTGGLMFGLETDVVYWGAPTSVSKEAPGTPEQPL